MRYTAPSWCASLRSAIFRKFATVAISFRHTIAAAPTSATSTRRIATKTIAVIFTHFGARFFAAFVSSAIFCSRSKFFVHIVTECGNYSMTQNICQ